MKLSEMSTERAEDVLIEIVTPITSIAKDENIFDFFKYVPTDEFKEKPLILKITDSIERVIPAVLKTHRMDVHAIISSMTGKTEQEIRTQPIMVTLKDVRDFVDKDFVDFFVSAMS